MKALFDSRLYIQSWFAKSGLTVRQATSSASTFGSLYLDYVALYRATAAERAEDGDRVRRPLHERELRFAYDEYVDKMLQGEVRVATKHLSFNGGTLEALKTWVKAVTGTESELYSAVLAHWIWLIKRKSLGLPVKHQVMPILFGAQGGGKTMALEQFISPVDKYRLNLQMTSLADERMYKGFSSNLVVLFDELQNINLLNMNVLKNQITTTMNTFRPLHTNSMVNSPMNCSFIGASNKPINENFSDSTGMRRFFQIDALPVLDWAVINTIDYNSLWQSVDESLSDGYITGTMLLEVRKEQESLIVTDDFTTFIQECGIQSPEGPVKQVSVNALYLGYQEWCARNGVRRPYTGTYFKTKVKNLGVRYQVDANGRNACWFISTDATIDAPGHVKLKLVKEEAT